MTNRHQIRVVEEPYAPPPIRAEAIAPHLAEPEGPPVFGLDRVSTAEDDGGVVLIDESERTLTAAELFATAFTDVDEDDRTSTRRTALPRAGQAPGVQLWGSSTTGVPRRGSRCVRLFHDSPAVVSDRVRRFGAGDQFLRLEQEELVTTSGDEIELTVPGRLFGAFLLGSHPVRVVLRVARFNPLFTLAELTLESRRHPRRFFAVAHGAMGFLALDP